MTQFNIGDRVKVIGRKEWNSSGLKYLLKYVDKTGSIHKMYNRHASVRVDEGVLMGFRLESIIKFVSTDEQLKFDFML